MLARDCPASYSDESVYDALADDIFDYVVAFRGMPAARERCARLAAASRLPDLMLLFLLGAVEHGVPACPPPALAAMTRTARALELRYRCPIVRLRLAAARDCPGSALHESLLAAEIEIERDLIRRLTPLVFAGIDPGRQPGTARRMIDKKRRLAAALFGRLPGGVAAGGFSELIDIAFPHPR